MEQSFGNILAEHNKDAVFKSGGVQVERISYGDNMWTHRVVAFGEVGKIGRSDLKEFQQGLFLEKINNFVEEWGPAYAGRFKSFFGGVPKDFPFIQIYDIKPNDPIAFQKAHDKFISKASKILGDRPVAEQRNEDAHAEVQQEEEPALAVRLPVSSLVEVIAAD